MVVSDLLLTADATPSTLALTGELAQALDTWDGPGILIIAGNLFDLTGCDDPLASAGRAIDAHPALARSFLRFLRVDDRRILRQRGTHEPEAIAAGLRDEGASDVVASLAAAGVEHLGSLDLHVQTGTGERVVRVEPGTHVYPAHDDAVPPSADTKPGITTGAGQHWRHLVHQSPEDAPWLEGVHQLCDPSALSRFVVSRTLYRRFGRYAWWLLVPFGAAILIRLALTPWLLGHLGSGLPARALRHAHAADLNDQLVIALVVALVVLAVLAVVLGLLSRRMWSILGGGTLEEVRTEAGANDAARDDARRLVARGYAGLITAATFRSELTNLGTGFYANVGATAEVVAEHRGRLGLPPVFLHSQWVSWVEIESGAELHVRMLLAHNELPSPSRLERAVTRGRTGGSLHPSLVASYPGGRLVAGRSRPPPGPPPHPPGPPLGRRRHPHHRDHRPPRLDHPAPARPSPRARAVPPRPGQRGRRLAGGSGRPGPHRPRPGRPTGPAAGVAGVGGPAGRHRLPAHAGRGRRRGVAHHRSGPRVPPRQPQGVPGRLRRHLDAVGPRRAGCGGPRHRRGRHRVDRALHPHGAPPQPHPPVVDDVLGGVRALRRRHHHRPARTGRPLPGTGAAHHRDLPGGRDPVPVDPAGGRPAPGSGRAAEFRARDIVRRHGSSTLDYFALRSDKKWFFHRDSLVAYAVYGGVCLISPDPIGPRNEREQVWGAFRSFADTHGWTTAVMGAGEAWLPTYRDSGMHHIYLGDEAVVQLQEFSLAGKHMKGLRQAHNRIKKYGYTVTFHDPSKLDGGLTEELTSLMRLSRQGEHERGFSMMLGRVFDPRDTGLLLTVVRTPDGSAAAMCQFVPATGINGFSLDLMRRDPGEHPNGLLDFALCSTIEHLAARGFEGLSLNFAAMRSTLAGEKGDGTVQRAERWFLKRLSNFAQIESLWKFNAKYEPEWLPRYVVFDTAEHLVPVIMAILRAESLWEIPVLGRLLAAGAEKRMLAAQRDTDEFLASIVPWDEDGVHVAGADGPVPGHLPAAPAAPSAATRSAGGPPSDDGEPSPGWRRP